MGTRPGFTCGDPVKGRDFVTFGSRSVSSDTTRSFGTTRANPASRHGTAHFAVMTAPCFGLCYVIGFYCGVLTLQVAYPDGEGIAGSPPWFLEHPAPHLFWRL